MAKIFGQSGREVGDEAVRKRNRYVWLCITMCGICGAAEGIIFSGFFPHIWWTGLGRLAGLLTVLFALLAVNKWGLEKAQEIEKKRDSLTRAASGEDLVGQIISRFPNEFCVIHDVAAPTGSLDHVVVGPSGVYVLDTKAWRGVVAPDGRGELLLNGKPTDKPLVRQFVVRMMGIKDRVRTLVPELDMHFNGVFVFTAARVAAPWGSTGVVNCIRDDQLHGYIVESKYGTKLTPEQVSRVSQAFLSLPHADPEIGRPDAESRAFRAASPMASGDKNGVLRPAAVSPSRPERIVLKAES